MISLILAVAMAPSAAFDQLVSEAQRDPSQLTKHEDVKEASNPGFENSPSYHFEGKTPVKGISIYTPVKDQRGDEGNNREEAKDPFANLGKYQVISGGVAAAGLIGGFFLPPLWILGGIGLGVFAVLTYLKKKFGKKSK